MIVESHRLVRPGCEPIVLRAQRRRRALGRLLVVAAATVWIAGTMALSHWGAPLLPDSASLLRFVAPPAIAFLPALCTWWAIATWGERRWERVLRDPALTRDAHPLREAYGGIPDASAQELWDLLDRYDREGSTALHEHPFADDLRPLPPEEERDG